MKFTTQTRLISELEAAINGENVCVQAWLGIADVLFVGFGTEVLAPVPPKGKHPIPPYEINTNLSHWTVYKKFQVVGSSHDDPRARAASDTLVGKTALTFLLSPDLRHLRIEFSEGIALEIIPYEKVKDDRDDFRVWDLRLTDGQYLIVRNDLSIEEEE